MSRHNFGEHSHGMTRNSSPLLHLVIVQLAYFQTGKGHWQKKLMIKPVMFPHTVPEYLVDEGWISHLGRRNGTLLVFLRPLAASIAGGRSKFSTIGFLRPASVVVATGSPRTVSMQYCLLRSGSRRQIILARARHLLMKIELPLFFRGSRQLGTSSVGGRDATAIS